MTDLNFSNLPPQEGFTIDLKKLRGFDANPNAEEFETEDGVMRQPSVLTRAFGSNDIHITYLEFEPGEGIPWHTHHPDMYQVYVILEGTLKISFKDRNQEVHTTEVHADEEKLVYLPPGAHNQIENPGDETLRVLSTKKETRLPRVDYLVDDAEDAYDPYEDPEYGLEIDTMRGKVLRKQDEAVESY